MTKSPFLFEISNSYSIVMIVIISISFLIMMTVLIIGIYAARQQQQVANLIRTESASNISVSYDHKNDNVIYFNHRSFRRREGGLESFLGRFPSTHRNELREWLHNLPQESASPNKYFRVPLVVNNRQEYDCLIQVSKADLVNEKFHLSMHRLFHTTDSRLDLARNSIITQVVRKVNSLSSEDKASGLGFYFFHLFLDHDQSPIVKVDPIMYLLLLDRIRQLINGDHSKTLFELDHSTILIVDTGPFSVIGIEESGRELYHQIENAIEASNWHDRVSIALGVVSSLDYKKSYRSLIETGIKLSASATTGEPTITYQDLNSIKNLEQTYADSFAKIMEGRNIVNLFQPVVNPNNKRVQGYLAHMRLQQSYFSNFDELQNYASRHGDDHEFFVHRISSYVKDFAKQTNAEVQRLYVRPRLSELDIAIAALPYIERNPHLVFVIVFNEFEFERVADNEEILKKLKTLHNLERVELGLALRFEQLSLNPDLYKNFDYFILPVLSREKLKDLGDRLQIYYGRLMEKLLRYKKPLLATQVNNWLNIELLTRLGVDLISGSDLMPPEAKIRPLDKKKLSRLNSFTD